MEQERTLGTNSVSKNGAELTAEAYRAALLGELPDELRKKWLGAPVDQLQRIIEKREQSGFKKIYGIHISPKKLLAGAQYVDPGSDNMVHYTVDPKNLYTDKVGRWLYIVEGNAFDAWNDENIGWKKSHAPLRVVAEIPMDDEGGKIAAFEKFRFIKS